MTSPYQTPDTPPNDIPVAVVVDEFADTAHAPPSIQFNLRSLFAVMAGLSIVFAFLHLIGLDPVEVLTGFMIFGGVALLGVLCVELSGVIRRDAERNFHDNMRWR